MSTLPLRKYHTNDRVIAIYACNVATSNPLTIGTLGTIVKGNLENNGVTVLWDVQEKPVFMYENEIEMWLLVP